MMRFSRVLAGLVWCGLAVSAAPAAPQAALRRLPVYFEPNQGQFSSPVKFAARTGDGSLFLTAQGAALSLPSRRLEMTLLRSNPSPHIEGVDPLPSHSNYFRGSRREDWRTSLAHYARVRYQQVYPGIDMLYYGSGNRLEYDFVLRPGADARRIRMRFGGADRLTVTSDGDLLVDAGGAQLLQKKPLVYQQDPGPAGRREIGARYRLIGRNVVGIEVDPYDRTQPLTIDPALVYSSLLGGSGSDAITAIQVDKSGMIYLAGYTGTGDLTASDSAFQTAAGGDLDVFVAKIDPTVSGPASLVYFTYIGGSGADKATAMTVDAAGNVYVTGTTTSANFPLAGAAFQNTLAGGSSQDAFVLKLNPAAQGPEALVYSTYLGGTDSEDASGIGVDQSGAIYVIGTTRSTDFPLTASAYQAILWGPQDAFIAKLDPSQGSTLVYSSYLGGEADDEGGSLAVSPSGAVYIAGTTDSTSFPLAGTSYRYTPAGPVNIWVGQMDLTKSGVDSLVYGTYFGGSVWDSVRKIALDSSGKLLLAGYTLSPDFPFTDGAYQAGLAGNADAFVSRLDLAAPPSSVVMYSTCLGGSHGDAAYDVTSDSAGNIYLAGYTLSPDFPVTPGGLQQVYGGGVEVFFAKLNPAKPGADALVYSSFLGTRGVHVGNAIAVTSNGTIYVGGQTPIQDVFVTDSAAQNSYGGGLSDGFLVVVGP